MSGAIDAIVFDTAHRQKGMMMRADGGGRMHLSLDIDKKYCLALNFHLKHSAKWNGNPFTSVQPAALRGTVHEALVFLFQIAGGGGLGIQIA